MPAKLWIVLGLAGLGAACASLPSLPQAEAPSPRPECAPAEVTVYFTEESATLQPTTEPLLRDLRARIDACTAAGGALRGVTVIAYADHGARRSAAEAQMRTRAARVRAALVEAGIDNAVIATRRPRSDGPAIMGRRAEITADLY